MLNGKFISSQSHEYTLEPLKNRHCNCQNADTLTATKELSFQSELQPKNGPTDGT